MTGELTGKRVAAIFVLFFGTVIAVNVCMAMFASGTFGGTVVDNSYVASQHFNDWLGEAREGEALGWDVAHERGGGMLLLTAATDGDALSGLTIVGTARRPVGTDMGHDLFFTEMPGGRYAAELAPGRWQVRLTLADGTHERRIQIDLP